MRRVRYLPPPRFDIHYLCEPRFLLTLGVGAHCARQAALVRSTPRDSRSVMLRAPPSAAALPNPRIVTIAAAQKPHSLPSVAARFPPSARPSSQAPSRDPKMPAHPVPANARTSVCSRVGPVWLTHQSTAYALRREGTHRRRRQPSGPIEGAARAPPSCRATPSAAHGAILPPHFQCPRTRLRTDSCSDSSSLAPCTRQTDRIALVPRRERSARPHPPRSSVRSSHECPSRRATRHSM